MRFKKNCTLIIPSELLYLFDPDITPEFIIARELGKIVARPIFDAAPACRCCKCSQYDNLTDVCDIYS